MGLKIGRNDQAVLPHDPDSEYAPIHLLTNYYQERSNPFSIYLFLIYGL